MINEGVKRQEVRRDRRETGYGREETRDAARGDKGERFSEDSPTSGSSEAFPALDWVNKQSTCSSETSFYLGLD